MSGKTRIHLATLAVLIGTGLLRPSHGAAQSVSGDEALLNVTAPATEAGRALTALPSPSFDNRNGSIPGDRALLARTEAPSGWDWSRVGESLASVAVDGERALLGRWPAAPARLSEDWARRGGNEPRVQS